MTAYPSPINSLNEKRMYDRTGLVIIDTITPEEKLASIPNTNTLICFISQSGTTAPTLDILFNTIGEISLTYIIGGTYTINKTGGFPEGKTSPNDVGVAGYDVLGNKIEVKRVSEDRIQIKTFTSADTSILGDDILNKLELQITTYK
jgi:hypothetical protein